MFCYYTVNYPEFDDYMFVDISYDVSLKEMAKFAAKDYEGNSNWENATDAEFYLWNRDKEFLGKFLVEVDYIPSYYITEAK